MTAAIKFLRLRNCLATILYSDYALTNFQEFWAESIEIFFERPADMKIKYGDLYQAVCEILNQNPLDKNWPAA